MTYVIIKYFVQEPDIALDAVSIENHLFWQDIKDLIMGIERSYFLINLFFEATSMILYRIYPDSSKHTALAVGS